MSLVTDLATMTARQTKARADYHDRTKDAAGRVPQVGRARAGVRGRQHGRGHGAGVWVCGVPAVTIPRHPLAPDVPIQHRRKAKHGWRLTPPRCEQCNKQLAPGIDHSKCEEELP